MQRLFQNCEVKQTSFGAVFIGLLAPNVTREANDNVLITETGAVIKRVV